MTTITTRTPVRDDVRTTGPTSPRPGAPGRLWALSGVAAAVAGLGGSPPPGHERRLRPDGRGKRGEALVSEHSLT
jgi:hypothetical protein